MAVIEEAKVCISWFVIGSFILLVYLLSPYINALDSLVQTQLWLVLVVYISFTNFIICILFRKNWAMYHVAIRSLCLGQACGIGLLLAVSDSSVRLFGWYVTALAFFHVSEYLTTALTNPKTLSLGSFLLDHSVEYHVAAFFSLVEFSIEWYFFPNFKLPGWVSVVGLLMVVGGEFARKLAMYTAATNFNHYVQFVHKTDHVLITSGIYSLARHPAYVGWFYWSIGTQVLLHNPLCMIGYTCASWQFFNNRVYHEEISLLNFFRDQYVEYQKKVPTGLPFIKGYRIDL